jgi:hypothetical protein
MNIWNAKRGCKDLLERVEVRMPLPIEIVPETVFLPVDTCNCN